MKTRNKILAFGIILSMLFAMAAMPASAASSGSCGANVTWTLDDAGTLTISGTGNTTSHTWYSSRNSINSVIIENGVTSIGDDAFGYCESLTSITIPDSVTSIGVNAFSFCKSLTSITIPGSVTSIMDGAFKDCTGLTSVIIPDGVTYIGHYAFAGCTGLTSVAIPDSVTCIGDSAFGGCTSLTSITIPDGVTGFLSDAFYNTAYYSNDSNWENGVLYINNHLITAKSDITSIIIRPGIKIIAECAFFDCTNLTSVTIPNSVTSIGERAFAGCTNLTSVNITDIAAWCNISIDGIESNPLYYANRLYLNGEQITNLIIPDGVTSIGNYTFSNCSELTSIIIPSSVTSIGNGAFLGCSSLSGVYYDGTRTQWDAIKTSFTSPAIYFNSIAILSPQDYNGSTISLSDDEILVTGENLNFRNGYVNTGNSGYVKAGNKKITGSNIHFTESGKMKLDASEVAKVERDNGDGTTDQGFIAGVHNPTGIIKMTLSVSGTVNETDYTGRTISKDFDFTASEIGGLVNFGFEVKRVPKPLELNVESVE